MLIDRYPVRVGVKLFVDINQDIRLAGLATAFGGVEVGDRVEHERRREVQLRKRRFREESGDRLRVEEQHLPYLALGQPGAVVQIVVLCDGEIPRPDGG